MGIDPSGSRKSGAAPQYLIYPVQFRPEMKSKRISGIGGSWAGGDLGVLLALPLSHSDR